MELAQEYLGWAQEEFGRAELPDKRLRKRLIWMAARLASAPAGTLTAAFKLSAERQGAYDFLAKHRVTPHALAAASFRSTLARLQAEPFAFVALDGSSLRPAAPSCHGLGRLGTTKSKAKGLKTMTALVVRPDGTPLGLCAQCFWARVHRKAKKIRGKRKAHQTELRYWLIVMREARALFAKEAPQTLPWFQLDREGDAWPLLLEGLEPGQLFTVRASWNRCLRRGEGRYLWEALLASPKRGHFTTQVPAGRHRKARTALMAVRFCPVTLELKDKWSQKRFEAPLYAVYAREEGTTPAGEKPLEWMLLTTYPVATLDDACQVVFGYAMRWRLEDFHRTWKSGACRVEESQLWYRERLEKWALLLGAVAMRIERMKHLCRTEPEKPATEEFTQEEIDAVLLLKGNTRYRAGEVPSLGEVVRWVADLGGYTGKSSGGPPGAKVLGRGLQQLAPVVQAMRNLKKMTNDAGSRRSD